MFEEIIFKQKIGSGKYRLRPIRRKFVLFSMRSANRKQITRSASLFNQPYTGAAHTYTTLYCVTVLTIHAWLVHVVLIGEV